MQLQIRRMSSDVPMPEYKTSGACAFDIAVIEGATLAPGERKMLQTGLIVKVPDGHTLLLFSRSSNAKKGIRLGNSVGVIDQDYCGPSDQLYAAAHNFGHEPYTIEKGERLMQAVIVPIVKAEIIEATGDFAEDRGGFGTTG